MAEFPILRGAPSTIASFLAATAIAYAQAPVPEAGQLGKDVMWVATGPELVERMLDMANLTNTDVLFDLGSGDGVVVIAAAKRGARAIGIEYDAGLTALARRLAAEAGVGSLATFVQADLFKADLSAATVVTMYLTEGLNLRIRPKLLALRPGTRIVSQPFLLGDWRPDDSVTVISLRSLFAPFVKFNDHCFFRCSAYLWIVPAKVEGEWGMAGGKLVLKQTYQNLNGVLDVNGSARPLLDARLRGNRIMFASGDTVYAGEVSGDTMSGDAERSGSRIPWKAVRTR